MPEPREKARRKLQCFDVSWESRSTAAEFYGENYLHLLKGEASQNCGVLQTVVICLKTEQKEKNMQKITKQAQV